MFIGMTRICLVVADASRARIFTYERSLEPEGMQEHLTEEQDLVDSTRRKTASQLASDRSGANHVGGRSFVTDDHRQRHLDELDAEFAREIATETERIARERGYHDVLVVASSRMLGRLRRELASLRKAGITVDEIQRDYTRLSTQELRERLAELAVLPPPTRLAAAPR